MIALIWAFWRLPNQPTKDSGNSQGADYSEGNSTQYEFLEIIDYG